MRRRAWLVLLVASITSAVATAVVAEPSRIQRNYTLYCSGCHLADGAGSPAKGIPSMQGALGRFLQVPGGREFIAQIPGVMNSPLKDAQVAELMNWLLPYVSAQTLPAGTAPYTTEEIARLRKSRPSDVAAARHAIVERGRAAGIEIDAPVDAR